jgi:mediator of RNA polymerase II transcription subunit 13
MIYQLQDKTARLFGFGKAWDLLNFSALADPTPELSASAKAPPRAGQPKPSITARNDVVWSGMPIKIPAQFVRVRRNDNILEMQPPAIPFWEVLGLGPASGPKHVISFVMHPANPNLRHYLDKFMSSLATTYETLKLGTHERGFSVLDGKAFVDSDPSFIAWEESPLSGFDGLERDLKHKCKLFGEALAAAERNRQYDDQQNPSFVVYMVNPVDDTSTLPMMCSAFWTLFESYRKVASPDHRKRRPDVVLQILPISYIAKPGGFVTLQTHDLQNLAREVYNRCPPPDGTDDPTSLSIYSATSIQLTEMLPKRIPFELVAEPPSNILHDSSQLHIGYAVSASGNWITAAYTDNAGKYQAVVSYCLSGSRTFGEVAKEIWQTCIQIMVSRKINWRLCVCKAGLMKAEEINGMTVP